MDRTSVAMSSNYLTKNLGIKVIQEFLPKVQQMKVSSFAMLIEVVLSTLKGVLLRIYKWIWSALLLANSILLGLWSCVLRLARFVLWSVPCGLFFICCPCIYWILNKQDRKCIDVNQPSARDAVNNFLSNNRNKYACPTEMNCLGSRLHKQWFKAQTRTEDVLITSALVSQNCPLKLTASTLQGINELLTAFKPHPFLHWVLEVSYDRDFQHVIIVQKYISEGSLKDMIYRKADADADWSEKYRRRSNGLPNMTVLLYGRQILEAMMYLYRCGFPYHQLGHVQTGNVFIGADGNTCCLGGYENTLLGYKTRLFRLCRQYEDRIDIVMFGHLLFEMCCGYELTTCHPRKQDYKSVKDKLLKSALQYIFKEGFPHSIEEISKKQCFNDQQVQIPQDQQLSQKCQSLLEKLRMSAPQQQDPPRTGRKQPPPLL